MAYDDGEQEWANLACERVNWHPPKAEGDNDGDGALDEEPEQVAPPCHTQPCNARNPSAAGTGFHSVMQ